MPVKRGLVAPQNIFIQTIIKKFDGSPDRNFVLGNAQVTDLPIIYCNDGFCELTGYSRAELVQKHCSCDFLCGENTDAFAAREVKSALKGQEEKHVEILYYKKDGSPFLCSVLVAPVKNEEGIVVMYIVNHEDVTWSPNRDDVVSRAKCFQFPLQVNRIPAFIQRKRKPDLAGVKDEDAESLKSNRDPETHITYTSSGNSDIESPPAVPFMNLHPPTPNPTPPLLSPTVGECSLDVSTSNDPFERQSLPPKPTSLTDVSRMSPKAAEEAESLLEETQTPTSKPGNMLYIPELSGRLSSAASESSLWNYRNKPQWLDTASVDFKGSAVLTSPGINMQQLVQPRKTEKVAQVMSLGADVLPEYKLQAPKIHPWTILHYSPFKAFWDWLILFLVIYTAIVTPYVASFILTRDKKREDLNRDPETRRNTGPVTVYSDPLVIVDYIVDVMFIIDIFINFRTTFVDDNDEVVSHPCRIAVHYLKTWFVIDLVAAIPFELLIMIGNTNQTTTLIGLLKTARLLRLVRVARKLDHYSEYGTAVLCLLMCSFALLAHWLACIWYFIGYLEFEDSNITTIGWLDSLGKQIHRPFNRSDPTSGPDLKSKYVTALYFTLSSLTSVGFGNVSPNTNSEKIFSICVMLIGSLFYAAIFGNVAAIIARLYSSTSRYHAQMQKVREFIRFYQIPSPLRQRVEDYAHHAWSYTNGIDMEQVLKHFPECLQADICLHLNSSLLQSYPAFTSAPLGCLRALALRIKTTHLPPGDYIIYQGDEVNNLYFVIRGTVEVLSGDVIMAILGKGDSFGENFAIDPSKPVVNSNTSIRALTYCEMRTISREDVLYILNQYPLFRENFIKDLEITYNLRGGDIKQNFSRAESARDSYPGVHHSTDLDSVLLRQRGSNYASKNLEKTNGSMNTSKNLDARPRPTRLNIANHSHFRDEKSSTLRSEASARSYVAEEAAPITSEWKRGYRTSSHERESSCVKRSFDRKTDQFDQQSVCRDCCNSIIAVETKLDNLSNRLQRLESKLSTDMESIFEILKARKHPTNVQTQV